MFFISFRIALTLDVKIVWFHHQKAACVTKWHKNTIFGLSQFQKVNCGCLLLKLFIYLKNQLCVSLFIYHDFRDSNIFHTLFGLWVTKHAVRWKFLESDSLAHFRFMMQNLWRKPKMFLKVIQRFWYMGHSNRLFPPWVTFCCRKYTFFSWFWTTIWISQEKEYVTFILPYLWRNISRYGCILLLK